MIEQASRKLATYIKEADPEGPSSVEVMAWVIGLALNFFLALVLTAVAGLSTDNLGQTLFAFFSFCLIRFLSGGHHLNSLTWCSIVTALLIFPIPLIDLSKTIVLILSVISVLMFLYFAPFRKQDTNLSHEMSQRMKFLAVLLILSNLYFLNPILALVFFFQSTLLVHKKEVIKVE
ncbi:accessory gene regulator B family protein [Paenibacillus sp. RUD330]|uniref:accessory gene regulator B family protein n=1 Tax=Paenibacillus sp. RUD330 TaxID=2023772 RepID=UPI000B928C1E|nr:accessory gene regulator B family protein [Paenibacillus sp. RUD330]ASS66253.1 hypothetical protein CIC07_08880 [Paenibacillus sp. RUD330]